MQASEKDASLESPPPEPQVTAPAAKPMMRFPAREWSLRRKLITFGVADAMTLALTYSSTGYSSSIRHLQQDLDMSNTLALAGVSLFVLGFGVGSLLLGPSARVWGKRPVYIVSYLGFTIFAFVASESQNKAMLLASRMLCGIFGSSSLNNAPATSVDLFDPSDQTRYGILYAQAAFAGPSIGPVISAFLDTRTGWRWNLRVQAIFVAVTTVLCILFVEETDAIILTRREAEAKGEQPPMTPAQAQPLKFLGRSLMQPFRWLVTDLVVLFCAIFLSLLYAMIYAFVPLITVVFSGARGFGPDSTGLVFLALLVGFMLSGLSVWLLNESLVRESKTNPSAPAHPPERRLALAAYLGLLPALALWLFAWTAPFTSVHFIVPVIAIALFALGAGIIFMALIPYLAAYRPTEAPNVLASAGFLRAVFAAFWPLCIRPMTDTMTIQGATSFLAALAMLMAPLPIFLRRNGATMRARAAARSQ